MMTEDFKSDMLAAVNGDYDTPIPVSDYWRNWQETCQRLTRIWFSERGMLDVIMGRLQFELNDGEQQKFPKLFEVERGKDRQIHYGMG